MPFPDQVTALARLFDNRWIATRWFSANMRRQDMPRTVGRAIRGLRRRYGRLCRIGRASDHYRVVLERAEVPVSIVLDPDGAIAGLLLRPATPTTGTLAAFAGAIAALPGRTSCLVVTGDVVRHEHAADEPLAVGSAAKLAVLRAVVEAVAAGRLRWDQVCLLNEADRSLPSGLLQDWPPGVGLTLESLAGLMISISDNTATDALLRLVGRDAVERWTPSCRPFPSTREAFLLKSAAQAGPRAEWLQGDAAQRREVLARLATHDAPSAMDIVPGAAPQIEWFIAARDLARQLAATRDAAAFRIAAGPLDRGDWRAVAFKGGSEAEVLNLSVALESHGGRLHRIVATWNATEEIDAARLITPFLGIAHALRSEDRT